MLFDIRDHAGEQSMTDHDICFDFLTFVLNYSQFRSAWLPVVEACLPPNMESNKFVIIAILATDILLVVTMLFGLLRSRDRSGGMFGLARLLWKQVRWRHCRRSSW
jgi:hypothetical protein